MIPWPPQMSSRNIFYPCVAGFVFLVFWLSRMGPIGNNLFVFSGLYAGAFFILVLIARTFPDEWTSKRQFLFIIFVAILCRSFFLTFPASYDVNRYIWEGHVVLQGFNPYVHPPNDPVLNPVMNHIWHDINHKNITACYPPMAILFFSLLASISQSPLFFKGVFILFDLALIPLLVLIAQSHNIKASRVVFYALNPLVLVFIAGEGHFDVIHVFFICLSFYCFTIKKENWGFFSLGCAIMSKYYALILFPFLVNSKNWKKSFALIIPFISYLPFSDAGPRLFSSLAEFGAIMHYNDSVNVLLRAIFGPNAVFVSVSLLLVCLALIFLIVHDQLRSSYLAFGSLLLLLPTLHPWYLILITPFLVFFPSRAWLFLHFAVVFTFPVLRQEYHTGVFQEIHWLKIFEYLPFFGLLIWDFVQKRGFSTHPFFTPSDNLSVVIPTLNESRNISPAIKSLDIQKGLLETIVVDGGSTDGTQHAARAIGAKVVEGDRGRGLQINKGARQCRGDVVLILHADCCILPGTFERILKELKKKPHCIGGSLGMRFESASINSKFLAMLNNMRARWTGISFGDQGQFFRRESLDLIGGFPRQMLMEDVELSLRLKESGATCFLPHGIIVSHRRWSAKGFLKNFQKVITLCLAYLVKRRLGIGDTARKSFYDRYYTPEDVLPMKP